MGEPASFKANCSTIHSCAIDLSKVTTRDEAKAKVKHINSTSPEAVKDIFNNMGAQIAKGKISDLQGLKKDLFMISKRLSDVHRPFYSKIIKIISKWFSSCFPSNPSSDAEKEIKIKPFRTAISNLEQQVNDKLKELSAAEEDETRISVAKQKANHQRCRDINSLYSFSADFNYSVVNKNNDLIFLNTYNHIKNSSEINEIHVWLLNNIQEDINIKNYIEGDEGQNSLEEQLKRINLLISFIMEEDNLSFKNILANTVVKTLSTKDDPFKNEKVINDHAILLLQKLQYHLEEQIQKAKAPK